MSYRRPPPEDEYSEESIAQMMQQRHAQHPYAQVHEDTDSASFELHARPPPTYSYSSSSPSYNFSREPDYDEIQGHYYNEEPDPLHPDNFYHPLESPHPAGSVSDYNHTPHVPFEEAFVPNVYNADDDEEREYDGNINYDDIHGDHYEVATIQLPPTPSASLSRKPSTIRGPPPSEYSVRTRHAPPPSLKDIAEEEEVVEAYEDGYDDAIYDEYEDYEEFDDQPKFGVASGVNGHLVLDCPVASELLSKFPDYNPVAPDGGLSREFAFMRYTAVTCGPSNFYRDGYVLRPVHYPMPRQTELMVVITMYNEDDILLARTLKGVFKNIKHLESRKRSPTWGKDSWKKVVVCIVSDGRSKINERAQALLAALGVYQEGLAKSRVDDKKVQAHIYEYTTRVGISSVTDTVKLTTERIVPVQLLFCLKEQNAKKINSHRWCFQALGQVLDPKIVVLLDAGTQPTGRSLYHLWQEFDKDAQVAGACGEIKASLKKRQIATNPLVYAQNFEYKMSNILDKPTESVFGFISVLPGAFSAYRYVALQNDINGKGPLEKYFKGEFLHSSGELDPNDDEYELKSTQLQEEAGIFTSNMYLAEDRILCFELVAKKGCSWLLRYVKSASAETDVPERLAEFILQRRRWLNGSFFAAIYALVHFPKIWKSSHSGGRKFWLHVEFFYQFINLVVSWFSLASYFLVFRILCTGLEDPDLHFAPGKVFSVIFLWLYLASIVTTFVLSFGNKPKGTEKFYIVIVVFFAVLMAYMIFAAIFMAVNAIKDIIDSNNFSASYFFSNSSFRDLVVATSSTYALYFIASFMYLEPWHMFTSFFQYILLSPSYVNVLNIYAFCNIDDVSWGTKGDTGPSDLGSAKVREDGTFDVSIPVRQEEVNQSYLNQLEKIKAPQPKNNEKAPVSNEDYYAFVRSMTVLVWMFSNFVIIAVVLEAAGFDTFDADNNSAGRAKIFLTVILWIVAFMALFRFIGCTLYLIQRLGTKFKGSDRRLPKSFEYRQIR
ncbi:chitin synthase 2 [Diutina catenulata]